MAFPPVIALRAALVLAALVFVPRLLESFEVPKIAIVRVLGLAALAGWLAHARWRGRRPTAFEWALLAWLAVEGLTTAASVSPRLSLWGDALQHEGLLTSLALAGLALAARDGLAEPRALGRTLDVALVAAALACGYALLQVSGFDPLPWTRTAGYGAGFVRPFGTLGHPNLLGVVGAAACAWATALALRRPERRFAYAPLALLTGIATVVTFSRAAWLGLAAGLAVVALGAWLDRRELRVGRRAVVVAGVTIVLVVLAFRLGGWERLFAARAGEFGQGGGETGASRVEIWKSALAMTGHRPLVGMGPDTFELAFPRWQTPAYWRIEWAGVPFHAHSVYLHALATRGAAGVLALAALALAAALAARRAWRAGQRWRVVTLAGGSAAIVVAGLAGAIGVNGALWLLCSAAALDAAGDATRPRPAAPGGARAAAFAAFLLVGAAVAWLSYRDLGASAAIAYAERARESDPAGALAAAEHAAALQPSNDRAWGALADARLAVAARRRDPAGVAAAQEAARRASALEPRRLAHRQRLGSVLGTRALLGDPGAAVTMERAYAAAAEQAPYQVLPALEYARWEIVLGRPALAIGPAREAVRLYPRESLPRTTLAAALLATGARDSARAHLEIAMAGNWRPQEADRGTAADVLSRLAGERPPGP